MMTKFNFKRMSISGPSLDLGKLTPKVISMMKAMGVEVSAKTEKAIKRMRKKSKK